MSERTPDVEGLEMEAAKMEGERESLRVTVETNTNGVGVVAITKREVTGATLRLREGAVALRRAATEIRALRRELQEYRSTNEAVSVCAAHVQDIVDGPCVICALERKDAALREHQKWLDAKCDAAMRDHGIGTLTNELCEVRERLRALATGGDDG